MENSLNMEPKDYTGNTADQTELAPLSAFSQSSCIKSIINGNYKTQDLLNPTLSPPNLSEYSGSINDKENFSDPNSKGIEIFSSSKSNKDDILFCSLPKLYRRTHNTHVVERVPSDGANLFTKMIDIILSGAEMV